MVGPWFTTPWRLASQSHGAVAWRFRPPIPSLVPLCHIPSPAHSQRPVDSLSPGAVVRPHSIPHPVFIPHLAASNPVALALRILIHPGTVSCAWHWSLPSRPRPFPPRRVPSPTSVYSPRPPPSQSPWGRHVILATRPFLPRPLSPVLGRQQPFGAGPLDPHPAWDWLVQLALCAPFPSPSTWVVCSLLDLWWFLLPCSRAPRYPCLSFTWSPVVVVFASFCFFAPPAVSRLPVCSTPFPRRPLALRFSPSCVAAGFCSCFFLPPPFPAVPPALWFPPPCMHAQQLSKGHLSLLPLVFLSCTIALLGRGPWRSPAMPGGRPSLASHSFLCSPTSPLLCLLPALLLLFPCSVCSPLVVPGPCLYLARFHAPQGLRPVLRPVGRLGRPPQIPLRGDSPMVLPPRPPLHQFPDGGAGRPVRLNAGHRHGVFLCETMCTFAPLFAPCFPLLPRGPTPSVCPSLVPCLSFFSFLLFFSGAPLVALFAAHARPVCVPCSSPCYPCLAALCPLPRLFPLPSAVSLRVLPVVLRPPSLPLPRCHSCVPRARSTPAPLCCPYPVPWWLTYPCVFPSVPVSLHFLVAMVHFVGGGFTCGLDCGPARGRVRHWPLGLDDCDVPHAARTSGK